VSDEQEQKDPRVFTSGDVREAADLSYRQVNDWDKKGVLPEIPRTVEGWRRYTPRELFVIMICAEIRRQYGVPVESLRWLQKFMLQEGADHFASSVRLIAMLDLPVLLFTDLKKSFIMDSSWEFIDLLQHGFFYDDQEEGKWNPPPHGIIINVAPFARRLVGLLKNRIDLPKHQEGYRMMREVSGLVALTPGELAVLSSMRSADCTKVEVTLRDGKVDRITVTDHLDPKELTRLSELIAEHDYQSIKVVQRDGTTVTIEREIFIKPSAKRDRKPRSAKEADPHESD